MPARAGSAWTVANRLSSATAACQAKAPLAFCKASNADMGVLPPAILQAAPAGSCPAAMMAWIVTAVELASVAVPYWEGLW